MDSSVLGRLQQNENGYRKPDSVTIVVVGYEVPVLLHESAKNDSATVFMEDLKPLGLSDGISPWMSYCYF